MTKQRFSDIENGVLIGLLDAPERGIEVFKVDPEIFTTPLKRKIATTINKYVDKGTPEMAGYKISNTIDESEKYQAEWIDIQGNLLDNKIYHPITMIREYYDDLVVEHKERLFRGEL